MTELLELNQYTVLINSDLSSHGQCKTKVTENQSFKKLSCSICNTNVVTWHGYQSEQGKRVEFAKSSFIDF